MFGFEICDCHCHRMEGVKHCAPCCYKCPHCGQRIRTSCYDDHVKRCEPARKELMIEPCTMTMTVRTQADRKALEPFLRAFFVQDKPWGVKLEGVRVVAVSDHSNDPDTPHIQVEVAVDNIKVEE